jgi:hypothetical protein
LNIYRWSSNKLIWNSPRNRRGFLAFVIGEFPGISNGPVGVWVSVEDVDTSLDGFNGGNLRGHDSCLFQEKVVRSLIHKVLSSFNVI